MNPSDLTIYIVDDDEAVRRSVGNLLLAHVRNCSFKTFESGEAFIAGANLDASGVVLLDYIMDGMTGLEVFQALHERASPLFVVFLSGKGDVPVAVRAMEKGAVSWLSKPCTDDELLQTIQRATARATDLAVKRRNSHAAAQLWARLSPREKQAATLAAQGKTAKEGARILEQLHLAVQLDPRTFENHRAKALGKMNTKNSNELLLFLHESELWNEAKGSLKKSSDSDKD
jgi:FixJ family two-component response regulator